MSFQMPSLLRHARRAAPRRRRRVPAASTVCPLTFRCTSLPKEHIVHQRPFHLGRSFPTGHLSPYGRKHNLRFARMFQSSPLVNKIDDDRITGDATIQVDRWRKEDAAELVASRGRLL